jgi:hypothetical protein
LEDKRRDYEEKMRVIQEIELDKKRHEDQEREAREEAARIRKEEVKAMATQFKVERAERSAEMMEQEHER